MDTASSDLTKARELIEKARDILIVSHENPTFDSIGSMLALYLGLLDMGKRVTVAIPDPMTVEFSNFVGANKVVSEIARKNFIISLDYVEGSIEKVSYNIEGDKFNLVIEPRPGFEPFTKDRVHFSNSGTSADLVITVDTIHLGGLKSLYESDTDLYANTPVVNIDRHANNAKYGTVNIIDPQVGSTVELVAQVMSVLGIRLTADIATNILNALYQATSSFQSSTVSGRTFDLAAACIKAGGRRFTKVTRDEALSTPPVPQPRSSKPVPEPVKPPVPQPAIVQKPQEKKPEVQPQVQDQVAQAEKPVLDESQAPADWLKPKVFKSSQKS